MRIVESEEEYKKCVDEAEERALFWIWKRKSGKNKIIDAFNELCDNIKEREELRKKEYNNKK